MQALFDKLQNSILAMQGSLTIAVEVVSEISHEGYQVIVLRKVDQAQGGLVIVHINEDYSAPDCEKLIDLLDWKFVMNLTVLGLLDEPWYNYLTLVERENSDGFLIEVYRLFDPDLIWDPQLEEFV